MLTTTITVFKILSVLFLLSPSLVFSFTTNENLRNATQLLTDGSMQSLKRAENVSHSASVEEPKAFLAHWLRAQSLYGMAGVGYDFDKKDLPFIEEARVRIIPLPTKLLPANILPFSTNEHNLKYVLLMETKTSRLFVYKIDVFGNIYYENSFYSSIGLSGDNKVKEGDKKTPLGVYRFIKEIANPRADGFLGDIAMTLDYPNAKDKKDGRTGYGIWIHGVPKNTYVRSPKASDGCLALSNQDIQVLKKYITYKKTHIVIVSDVSWINKESWIENKKLIEEAFLSSAKDLDDSQDLKLLSYFRVSKDRPSVVLSIKNGKYYRDYWSETKKGLKIELSERLN